MASIKRRWHCLFLTHALKASYSTLGSSAFVAIGKARQEVLFHWLPVVELYLDCSLQEVFKEMGLLVCLVFLERHFFHRHFDTKHCLLELKCVNKSLVHRFKCIFHQVCSITWVPFFNVLTFVTKLICFKISIVQVME